MNCLPEPDPPTHLHCFPHALVIMISQTADGNSIGMSTSRSGVRSASAPPHEAGIQTHSSSPQVKSNESQQTIYNLQLARNVLNEMCFLKRKGSPRPDPTRSFAYSGPTHWELYWCVSGVCMMIKKFSNNLTVLFYSSKLAQGCSL